MLPFPEDLPRLVLQPGHLKMVRKPTILQTLLGSCVSVTFWNERLAAGAMCHGMLPKCPLTLPGGSNAVIEGARYVDFSIRYLAGKFDDLGVRREAVEVKIFGGADVLEGLARSNSHTVGAQNSRMAVRLLAEEGFVVRASDLGGKTGRTIFFHTGTGEVFLRRLDPADSDSKLQTIQARS